MEAEERHGRSEHYEDEQHRLGHEECADEAVGLARGQCVLEVRQDAGHKQGAGGQRGQQVAHLLLWHERKQHQRTHRPTERNEVGALHGDMVLPIGERQRGQGGKRPGAHLQEETPIVPPGANVVVGPRPSFFGHHRRHRVAMHYQQIGVPPSAHHHGHAEHDSQVGPFAACGYRGKRYDG